MNKDYMKDDGVVKIVTHSGSFHTDEAFAVATIILAIKNGKYKLIRTRDPEIIKTGDFVMDVGGEYIPGKNRFDHHQEGGAGKRENGVPYSSFGLVWKKFGEEVCGGSKEVAGIVDQRLVSSIDASDNRIDTFSIKSGNLFPYVIHDITMAFRPTMKETEKNIRNNDIAFHELVVLYKIIIEREIERANDEVSGRVFIRDIYKKTEDKRIIIIDKHYSWEHLSPELDELLYVVEPDRDNGGKWKVTAVRKGMYTFDNRKSFPEEWAGKRGEELSKITGVFDSVYCHNDRFIAIAGSKQGAIALANLAVTS